jgi:LuxR family maltose regulon positive regulatory protein
MTALLQHAVRRLHDGLGAAARGRARRLLERTQTHVGAAESQPSLAEQLSQRELEVLRLLDSELTGPEIARELYVTLNTLRTHTKRIFTKLNARTRAAAVQRAREGGLL